MNIFSAKKNGKEIVVVLDDDLVIEKYLGGLLAREYFLRRRADLKKSGNTIQHFPEDTKKAKKVAKQIKKVRVMGYWVRNDREGEGR